MEPVRQLSPLCARCSMKSEEWFAVRQGKENGGHGGNLQAAAQRFRRAPEDFLDFSSNINPLGPPPGLFEHLAQHLEEMVRYPVPQASLLRQALADSLGLPATRLLLGNGASELIHLLFLYLRPRRVLLPVPSFSEYARAAQLVGARVVPFLMSPGDPPDFQSFMAAFEGCDFLVLCNPNNPTGAGWNRPVLEEIIGQTRMRGITLLVDESFFPLTRRPRRESLDGLESENLWVVTSLTKLWALPGLRLGYLCGPRDRVGELTAWGDPWRVNALAQRAGLYCLADRDFQHRSVEAINREKSFLVEELRTLAALRVFPAEANFLLLQLRTAGLSASDLFADLAARGILIRDASNFIGLDRSFFRVAVRGREENKVLLRELSRCLGETGFPATVYGPEE